MAVVTIDGQLGSGGRELGVLVARQLEADYTDRLILAEAARRIGATVEALAQKERGSQTIGDRITRLIQTLLERSAVAGTGGDPYFGPGIEVLLARPYEEITQTPITRAQELDDQRFIEVTTEVIRDLARQGNVVIIGRAGCMILKDFPQALHIGLAANLEDGIPRIMERMHLERDAAERFIIEEEKGRVRYFRKFFKVHPDDPMLYHLMLNTSTMSLDYAAEIVVRAATDLEEGRISPK